MTDPTNTLILTGFSPEELLDKDIIQSLQKQIIDNTPGDETIQFSILKLFKRILIVFEKIESSERLYKILKECGFGVGFSSQNNYDDFILTPDGYKFDTREYLHLPSHGTTFIISPPPSPPPGWISTFEEPPEKRSIYSPEQLSELLYKRVEDGKIQKLFNVIEEGDTNTPYEKQTKQKEEPVDQKVLLQTNNITSPIIVLEAPENEELRLHTDDRKPAPKVAMPPVY